MPTFKNQVEKKEIQMTLKAKIPEAKSKRLKMFIYGQAGVGKTVAALNFPNAYIIDTEKGTDNYSKSIIKNNSSVLQTLNPDEVKEELRELLTTKHQFKTLIIDPITQIYNATQDKWSMIFEKHAKNDKDKEVQDFGMRYWGKVKGNFKSLQRAMIALDMNVIVTAHQKDVYGGNFSKVGVTFDSMKGDDYLFDLVFRIDLRGDKRVAVKVKERAEVGEAKFPNEFEWSYANFCKYYGKDIIEKQSEPVVMATKEQVTTIENLVKVVNIDEATIEKWFAKADISEWEDMTGMQINKCIEFVQKKLDSLNKPKETQKKGKVKDEGKN